MKMFGGDTEHFLVFTFRGESVNLSKTLVYFRSLRNADFVLLILIQ